MKGQGSESGKMTSSDVLRKQKTLAWGSWRHFKIVGIKTIERDHVVI